MKQTAVIIAILFHLFGICQNKCENCKLLDISINTSLFKNSFLSCDSAFSSKTITIIDTNKTLNGYLPENVCNYKFVISEEIIPFSKNVVFIFINRVFINYYSVSFFCPTTGLVCGFLFEKSVRRKTIKYKVIAVSHGSF